MSMHGISVLAANILGGIYIIRSTCTIDLSMLMIMCAPVHACNLPPCRCLPACLPALMLYIDALYAERAYTRALLAAYAVSCTVYNFL